MKNKILKNYNNNEFNIYIINKNIDTNYANKYIFLY